MIGIGQRPIGWSRCHRAANGRVRTDGASEHADARGAGLVLAGGRLHPSWRSAVGRRHREGGRLMVNSHGSREVKKGTADAIRQVDDAYNRTRLTPFIKGLFRTWLSRGH